MKKFILPATIALITTLTIGGMVQYARSNNGLNEPVFSFDETKVAGWSSGGNSNQQVFAGNDYKGETPRDELPTADMSVHHTATDGTANDDNCFALFSYYNFPLENLTDAYAKYEDRKTTHDDTTELTQLESSQQTIATHEGSIEFELRRYDLSVPGQDILTGYEIGFATVGKGHIRVEGVCKSADDLALTLPVIDAVTLEK